MITCVSNEATVFIEKINHDLGIKDTVKGKRIVTTILRALRNRVLFEESVFVFDNLPNELKLMFAEGWKVNNKKTFEVAQFNDVYDFLVEVKRADSYVSGDFDSLGFALKAVKSVFLNLYDVVNPKVMNYVIDFLPEDVKHLMLEYHGRYPVGYDSVEYKNIHFILESRENKARRNVLLNKLSKVFSITMDFQNSEDIFCGFLRDIRDSLSLEDSVKFFCKLPDHIRYFYVDGWLPKKSLQGNCHPYWIEDLLLVNHLSSHAKIYNAMIGIPEVRQILDTLLKMSSEGWRIRLKMLMNHRFQASDKKLVYLQAS